VRVGGPVNIEEMYLRMRVGGGGNIGEMYYTFLPYSPN
jgi:hypothetical protein